MKSLEDQIIDRRQSCNWFRLVVSSTCIASAASLIHFNSANCDNPTIPEKELYLKKLQNRFLSHFLPPRGNLSDGVVKTILLKDGKLEHVQIVKHIKISGRACKDGDLSLAYAVRSNSPVEKPPASIRCPLKLTVRFVVINKVTGGFGCIVQMQNMDDTR